MTWRAAALGFLLGLIVSLGTHFNLHVIRQPGLIQTLLPVAVVGSIAAIVLWINPLVGVAGRLVGQSPSLRPAELAVAAAIALAACGLPGVGFFGYYLTSTGLPIRQAATASAWQSQEVLAYVPGASSRVAPGQIVDLQAMARQLVEAADTHPADARRQVLERLWLALPEGGRERWRQAARDPSRVDITEALRALNLALAAPAFLPPRPGESESDHLRRARAELVAALPEHVLPPPRGAGTLITDPDAVNRFVTGASADTPRRSTVPWRAVWPSLRLWGGLALLLGAAAICLAVIVHPQWTRRELLVYPVARLITEMTARRAGRLRPEVMLRPQFWAGLIVTAIIGLLNGLHGWFQNVPEIPLDFDFGGLSALFPTASTVPRSFAYLSPTIFPVVTAFAFFLARPVSLSLGLAPLVWIIAGVVMMDYGLPLSGPNYEISPGVSLRFGAWVGLAIVVVYIGRRYYGRLAWAAMRCAPVDGGEIELPRSAVWATRGMVVLLVAAVVWLHGSGLAWPFAAAFVLLCMMIWLVMSRVVAETGLFSISPPFLPGVILLGLLGFETVGPTAYLIMGVGGLIMVGDTKQALMPNILHGLKIADDRVGGRDCPARVAPWLATMVAIGFVAAAAATLHLQFTHGVDWTDTHAIDSVAPATFDQAAIELTEADAAGRLIGLAAMAPLERLAAARADPQVLWLGGLGFAAVIALMWARLRWSWWPLHPVLAVVLGMWSVALFAASFLLGWLLKTTILRMGGERLYRRTVPFMVGLIAGEMMTALLWILVGAVYYFATGRTPAS